MRCYDTFLPDVKIFEPKVFEDSRGFFMEIWNASRCRGGFVLGLSTESIFYACKRCCLIRETLCQKSFCVSYNGQ
ncbi:dTDP-4-dehydrorhamnose 3,5-epimerase family protein [Sporomusa acidovorans]|uniref:Uncharacterized protein n=1 Tax=Sporomusa acidovorans (strain ATCC 49682 / DSM 3132 / Mol) TaxID=1123286 RepID=A0ABZ3JAH1_SPOA4|nr:dTDP-4-dehydrorhamnose 3,5-epimerase family protein [Sporomusa acidovorans]OZC15144.1 hypothetical protein SPACI_50560 [Sporomusa acidovorans DSM 3132]SDF43949.1 dTDP-4-dehydrorhamnose 3,5-epimerase [Sporomusa acidovorans]